MLKTTDIRDTLISKYKANEFVIDKTNAKMIEIIGANFLADSDTIIRAPNMDYVKRELEWYESESIYVDDIPGETPAIWKQVANRDGAINSNYGHLIGKNNHYQYLNTYKELCNNQYSRRATMIYNRPSMHYDYNYNGMNDFVCTYANQFFIRNNKLISHYIMRSNDAVFGFCNDYHWAKHVQFKLLTDLRAAKYPDLEEGDLIWTASSFHVYERHFKYLDNLI